MFVEDSRLLENESIVQQCHVPEDINLHHYPSDNRKYCSVCSVNCVICFLKYIIIWDLSFHNGEFDNCVSLWCDAWLPWRQKQHVPLKCSYLCAKICNITLHNTMKFIQHSVFSDACIRIPWCGGWLGHLRSWLRLQYRRWRWVYSTVSGVR